MESTQNLSDVFNFLVWGIIFHRGDKVFKSICLVPTKTLIVERFGKYSKLWGTVSTLLSFCR